MDLVSKLNKALKIGSGQSGSNSFRHENEAEILATAKEILAQSPTGAGLLKFSVENRIEMHVLKNKQDIGFLPDKSVAYISCPAGQKMPTLKAVIHLAGALRQAEQETEPHLKRPQPSQMPKDRYVQAFIAKDKDILFTQTKVVAELAKVNGLLEIVDEFASMGYLSLYQAYQEDTEPQGLQ